MSHEPEFPMVHYQLGEDCAWHVPYHIIKKATDFLYAQRMKNEGLVPVWGEATAGDRWLAWAALIGSGLIDQYETDPKPWPIPRGGEQG